MTDIAIRVHQASFGYQAKAPIFDNICCEIRYGEVFAILGPNGLGKTTFLKTIMGILPLTRGSITEHKTIGWVPQSFTPAFSYSVLDIVLMGRAAFVPLWQTPSAHDRKLASEALALLGLNELSTRDFTSLSGGQRQLVLIARAITMESRVILLDEPMSALDLGNQERVLSLMQYLAKEKGIAVVFTTHQPEHALTIAQQALLMSRHHAPQAGATQDVLTSELLSAAYNTALAVVEVEHQGHHYKTVLPEFIRMPASINC